MIIWQAAKDGGPNVWVIYPEDDRPPEILVETEFVERNAELSPDGRWLVYQSNETGGYEVWVVPFSDARLGRRTQLTFDGGTRPMWSGKGDEIFYLAEDSRMMAVPVRAGATLERLGNPVELFRGPYGVPYLSRYYDYSPRHDRFLMVRLGVGGDSDSTQLDLVLVQNWYEELKRLVPTD